jgi:hypothetical protein
MKHKALLPKLALLFVLLALVLVVAITVQASVSHEGGASRLPVGHENGVPPPPADSGNIRDVLVGPPPTDKAVPVPPLEISEEQRAANASIQSDDFNRCTLDNTLWTQVDPLTDATFEMEGTFTNNAWLTINVPAGTDHDIWYEGNKAPRALQAVTGNPDFDVVTKFESGLSLQYQMQGMVVQQTDRDLLRLEYYSNGTSTYLFAAILKPWGTQGLTPTVVYNQPVYANATAPLWMRIQRVGSNWKLYHSNNGASWSPPEGIAFPHTMTVNQVGVYAANAQPKNPAQTPPEHTAKFDYFFNYSELNDPEDADRNTLTVNVVGQGSVDKDPDKGTGSHACEEEVTLTAQGDPGWGFSQWSGDLTGTTNPATLTMDGSKEVTATFLESGYTLTVTANPSAGGTVEVSPPGPYVQDAVVTLRPQPNLGYRFVGWSGPDATDVVAKGGGAWEITIDESKSVTAEFEEADCSLTVTVNPTGAGNVARKPPAPNLCGEVICLRPVPNQDWSFSGWGGPGASELIKGNDATACPDYANAETWHLTLNDNTQVTANFGKPGIYLPIVVRSSSTSQ